MLSEPFSVSPLQMTRIMCKMYFSRNWWWFALPVVACLALGAVNVNFLFVALMLVFIIVPMVMTLVYINYALTLEVRWSVLEKSVELTSEGLELHFTEGQNIADRIVAWSDFSGYRTTPDHLLLMLKVRRYTFIALPYSAIGSKDDLRQLVKTLQQHGVTLMA